MRRASAPHLALLLLLVAYLAVALWLFHGATRAAYFDTEDYAALARLPWTSAAFWSGAKPPGYALFLRAFAGAPDTLVRLQLAVYLVGFLTLAAGLARRCRQPWVRVGCCAGVLATSLASGLFYWCKSLSTESLSISLLVLPLGLMLFGAPSRRWARLAVGAAAALALLLWAALRDTDAAWLTIAATVAAVAAWPTARRRSALVQLAVALMLMTLTALSIRGGDRWRFPLVNVLASRVLPDAARKSRYERAGMPDNPKVRCFQGRWASDCNSDFSGFEPWLTRSGRTTYLVDLLTHPRRLLTEPLAHWRGLLCGRRSDEPSSPPLTYYFRATPPAWQRTLSNVVLADWGWLSAELALAAALLALQLRRRRLDGASAPLLLLLATVYPMMVLIWHGDGMEIQRHAIVIMVLLRVALCGLVALAIDRLRAP